VKNNNLVNPRQNYYICLRGFAGRALAKRVNPAQKIGFAWKAPSGFPERGFLFLGLFVVFLGVID
jgi:hypothetical protein